MVYVFAGLVALLGFLVLLIVLGEHQVGTQVCQLLSAHLLYAELTFHHSQLTSYYA